MSKSHSLKGAVVWKFLLYFEFGSLDRSLIPRLKGCQIVMDFLEKHRCCRNKILMLIRISGLQGFLAFQRLLSHMDLWLFMLLPRLKDRNSPIGRRRLRDRLLGDRLLGDRQPGIQLLDTTFAKLCQKLTVLEADNLVPPI